MSHDAVRLKLSYKSPESLLGEFTRSIGKGGVAIESRRWLPLGTAFVFELHAQGVRQTVEVQGEVIQCNAQKNGRYLVNIRYVSDTQREGLDEVLQAILARHRADKKRQHPRLPIMLRATEESAYSTAYTIRDLSAGGMRLEIESDKVPKDVRPGVPFLCEVSLPNGSLALYGEIVWAMTTQKTDAAWVQPSFGVRFGKLRKDIHEKLARLLALRDLPPAPWRARISFGLEAVSRMP